MSVKVDQALVNSFINGGFGLGIAHENIDFTPTVGTEYAEVEVFSAGSSPATLSSHDERVGVFQVILRYPTNEGAIAAKTKAEAIFDHFYLYSQHSYSDQSVEIIDHALSKGAPEPGWYKLLLRMRYRAYTPR